MKKLLLFVMAMACVSIGSAQTTNDVQLGVRGGLNFSNVSFAGFTGSGRTTFNVGVSATLPTDFNTGLPFFLESGLYLQGKGISGDGGGMTYLQLPAMIGYGWSVKDNIQIQPALGFYLGYGIAGDMFKYDGAKRMDFGFRIGAGVKFQSYYIGLSYDAGLMNIAKSTDDNWDDDWDDWDDDEILIGGAKMKNRCFSISVGYYF